MFIYKEWHLTTCAEHAGLDAQVTTTFQLAWCGGGVLSPTNN